MVHKYTTLSYLVSITTIYCDNMKLDIEQFKVKKPQDLEIDLSNDTDISKILKLHGGKTLAEKKYDGFGILVDNRNKLALYSLAKNPWNPNSVPELCDDFAKLPKGFYVGEIVGKKNKQIFTKDDEFFAANTRNFENPNGKTLQLASSHPLEIRVYDILQLGSKILATTPTKDIKTILADALKGKNILPVEHNYFDSSSLLLESVLEQISNGSEGFVVKNPNGTYSKNGDYVVGSRNKDWIKIKSKVTFDCAVLGLYQTETRLAQGWKCSNLLLGVYNEDTGLFETITKLTVASEDIAKTLHDKIAKHCKYSFSQDNPYNWQNKKVAPNKSSQVLYSPKLLQGSPNEKVPYLYVENPKRDSIVVEVSAMQITTPKDSWHSCGLTYGQPHSLRQPVYVKEREKKPLEATTTKQIRYYINWI